PLSPLSTSTLSPSSHALGLHSFPTRRSSDLLVCFVVVECCPSSFAFPASPPASPLGFSVLALPIESRPHVEGDLGIGNGLKAAAGAVPSEEGAVVVRPPSILVEGHGRPGFPPPAHLHHHGLNHHHNVGRMVELVRAAKEGWGSQALGLVALPHRRNLRRVLVCVGRHECNPSVLVGQGVEGFHQIVESFHFGAGGLPPLEALNDLVEIGRAHV